MGRVAPSGGEDAESHVCCQVCTAERGSITRRAAKDDAKVLLDCRAVDSALVPQLKGQDAILLPPQHRQIALCLQLQSLGKRQLASCKALASTFTTFDLDPQTLC